MKRLQQRLRQLWKNVVWLATTDLKQRETVLLQVRDLLGKKYNVKVK